MWMDALRVDENKCKEKKEKKTYFKSDVSMWMRWHADTNWMQMAVKKKKRNTYWTQILDANGSGCRWWNTQISGGAVDDSARVSLYLEIFV